MAPSSDGSTAVARAAASAARVDGYLPIRQYAALGDGRTVALVGIDGSIDWLPLPALDAPPAFAAVLDPDDGGAIHLAPEEEFEAERRYVPGTNVVETVFRTESGAVRVTDALNVGTAGRLPWTELARRVEGLEGSVPLRWEVAVGNRFATARPWTDDVGPVPVVRIGDQVLGVVTRDAGAPSDDGRSVRGTFSTAPGSSHLLAVVATDAEPLHLPSAEAVEDRLAGTVDAWRRWEPQIAYDGRWSDEVRRSAFALKMLIYAPTGAIAAAPTTSLPEAIGGKRNFDYRYAWIRDMSFVIEALARLDLEEEFHGALSWLLGTVRTTAPDLHVFYSLDGSVAEGEAELPLPGYRHSRPVLSGNGAATQTQLGTFGDLLEAVGRFVDRGNVLGGDTVDLVSTCADRVCDLWRHADAGLWELSDQRHYTSSKIGCWAALDRACRLAEGGHVPALHLSRWRMEQEAIRAWVDEHCWSDAKSAYTFHAGADTLDAATLLAARTSFDRGERLSSTIDAIRAELGRGPFLYRYSGMADREGAFLACSFWLAEALFHTGRVDEGVALMDELMDAVNDVGLLSEEIDPHSGELLGNFPMGLTHLALINAAVAHAQATRR